LFELSTASGSSRGLAAPSIDRRHSSSLFFGELFRWFLFVAVENLEPNRRLALVLKCAILAAGGAAIANQVLP
jgi:hypothetical protein